jgi:diacylglycerol kinase family enzyme
MARIALLSNPRATGNKSLLPRVRAFCAEHKDIFHYEVEHLDQVGAALRTIARVKPNVLVINGGDGTVQSVLTELHHGSYFGEDVPPVAVLPNGKTNLIAHDLGAEGDPIDALQRVLDLARTDIVPHIVSRELISLSDGNRNRPAIGMFLGGAGLADVILYCRHKVYPLGLPNGFSHLLTGMAAMFSYIFGLYAGFLPPRPSPMTVSVLRHAQIEGRFAFLMVTTLERLLLNGQTPSAEGRVGALQLLVIERRPMALIRAFFAAVSGSLGRDQMTGVHVDRGDEIKIEGMRSNVILDGELFEADDGKPIVLTTTRPVPFLRLAA